jgi:excisionase family DNA binding protein
MIKITSPAPGGSNGVTPDYDSKRQLAQRMSCSTRTIDNLMADGLPYIRLTHKLVRFPRAEVDAWLAQRRISR